MWWIAGLIKLMNVEDMFLPKCSHKINELVRFSKSVSVLHPAYMPINQRNLWLDSSLGLHPVQRDWKQAILAALFFSKVRKYSIIETETSTTKKPLTFQKKETTLVRKKNQSKKVWLVFLSDRMAFVLGMCRSSMIQLES